MAGRGGRPGRLNANYRHGRRCKNPADRPKAPPSYLDELAPGIDEYWAAIAAEHVPLEELLAAKMLDEVIKRSPRGKK